MKYKVLILFSIAYLALSVSYAQDADQSSSDSGVLVSSPTDSPTSNQDNRGDQGPKDDLSGPSDNAEPGHAADTAESFSEDPLIIKATNAVIFVMTANLKLTQDQINTIRPIITDTIIKVRGLEVKLKTGAIDSKTMYNQRNQLIIEANSQLAPILTQDQMKTWENMQNEHEFF